MAAWPFCLNAGILIRRLCHNACYPATHGIYFLFSFVKFIGFALKTVNWFASYCNEEFRLKKNLILMLQHTPRVTSYKKSDN